MIIVELCITIYIFINYFIFSVEEVYDEDDAADAAAIEQIHASVEAAFKALVNSMKSHGTRLTQSKEQLSGLIN